MAAAKSLMILIAGPYRSGTGDDPGKLTTHVAAMEALALPIFRAGHVPVVGEWLALPLCQLAGSTRVGDAAFQEVFHPIAERLLEHCDGVLRVGGALSGRSLTECGVALAGLQQIRIAIGEPLRVTAELDGKIDARAIGCVLGDADMAALAGRGLVVRDRPGGIAIEYLAAHDHAGRAATVAGELARRCEGASCAAAMLGPPDARLWLQLALDRTLRLQMNGPSFHRFAAAANALLGELRGTARDGTLPTIREQRGALSIEVPADMSTRSSVFLALNLRAQLVESFRVPSSSMAPTIHMNDYIFIGKGNLLGDPAPGDLLVYRQDTGVWVKRYLAGPGQTIAETASGIAIDGKLLATEVVDPAYRFQDGGDDASAHERTGALVREHLGARDYLIVRTGPPRSTGSWTVPPGQLFFIGDNRNNSNDSRYLGASPRDAIVGRVLGTWFAVRDGAPDWDRIGIPLD